MTFEETVTTLRKFVGQSLAINLMDERYGAADGYLADFSGRLSRIDEPIRGVDAPVFYFRIDDGAGFGVHEGMFRDAEWQTVGGERSLRIELDGVTMTVAPEQSTGFASAPPRFP